MDIGYRVKKLRKERDYTLKQLSTATGLSISFISDIENCRRNPSLDNLNKLANALGTSPDAFLTKSSSDNSHNIQKGQSNFTDTTTKRPKDLIKFLNEAEVMFDGELYDLDEDDRETLRKALEFTFWKAKEKNKRKNS